MITLEGLSQQQMQIAEMLWKCNSLEDVDRLVRNMPPTYRQDAVLVKELLIAAGLDEVQETDLADRALVDITLEGLSQQQMQIAEMLWKCNSLEDVDRLVRNMPPTYRQDAVLVKELLIAAGLDEVQETDLADRALVDIFGR